MTKKSETGGFGPPRGLSARSRALWRAFVPSRARSAGRRELLELALRVLDRSAELRALVDGKYVFENLATRAMHLNPGAKLLLDSEKQLARLWEQLGLSFDAQIDGSRSERGLAKWAAGEEVE